MVVVEPEAAERISQHFRQLADKPLPPLSSDTLSGFIRLSAESNREHAARIASSVTAGLSEEDARWAIADLVESGLWMRAQAYSNAPRAVQEAIPGGFVCRMLIHDLSPEADALDELALTLANAIPGLTPEERLSLCIG